MPPLPELLAPAGTPACALAAFESGADAVYVGLKHFSARERSENFTISELAALCTLARRKSKRVYVALNTLLDEKDLPEAARLTADAAAAGADAIIVQDIGMIRLVREYFPFLPIHASTQMGFHNSAGLQQAARMGITRVILERQVTLEELALLARHAPVELEVFVQGSLCLSLSGRCLLSSALGSGSGNRGRCAQPCRRKYSRPGTDSTGRCYLSPGDLSLENDVPLLRDLSIASVKIEGRLRREDYVESTVRAWRILLDENGSPDSRREAHALFSRVPGRRLTRGFADEKEQDSLVNPDDLPGQGTPIGRVIQTDHRGFTVQGERIYNGDKLRINPPGSVSPVMITALGVTPARGGWFVPCHKEIPARSRITRTGYSASGYSERVALLPVSPLPARLEMDLKLSDGSLKVRARHEGKEYIREYPVALLPAENRSVSPDQLEEVFRATAFEHLKVAAIHVSIDACGFLPASVLKKIRRTFMEHLSTEIPADWAAQRSGRSLQRFNHRGSVPSVLPGDQGAGPDNGEVSLPHFVPEGELRKTELEIRDLCHSKTPIRITALFQLPLIPEGSDSLLRAGFPLPVCNSLAEEEAAAWGLSGYEEWPESSMDALWSGKYPLLSTRARLETGPLRDEKGNTFTVTRDRDSCLTSVNPVRGK